MPVSDAVVHTSFANSSSRVQLPSSGTSSAGLVSRGNVASSTVAPVMIGSKPTYLTVQTPNGTSMRFLIMDSPQPANLHLYIKECRNRQVTDVVRVCEPTYPASGLEAAGIKLHEMPYPDGHSPPKEIIDRWLTLVDNTFFKPPRTADLAIAVHCVAGLGRAPVLVAIALIEFAHMDAVDAVTLIRKHRKGAINEKQLNWLENYRRSYKRAGQESCCIQ